MTETHQLANKRRINAANSAEKGGFVSTDFVKFAKVAKNVSKKTKNWRDINPIRRNKTMKNLSIAKYIIGNYILDNLGGEMSDKHKGIYRKYRVERLNDPTGKHSACNFFVLDLVHDKFSISALRAYAKACKKEYPQLAKDIQWALSPKVNFSQPRLARH